MCKKPEMKSKCKNRVTQKKMVIDIQPIFASVTAELVGSDISSLSNPIKKWEKFMMDTLLDWNPHYSLHDLLTSSYIWSCIHIFTSNIRVFQFWFQFLWLIIIVQIWQRTNALDKIWTAAVYGRRTEGMMMQLIYERMNQWIDPLLKWHCRYAWWCTKTRLNCNDAGQEESMW